MSSLYGSQDPDYRQAKTAMSKHLHRHHNGARLSGTVEERIAQHADIHYWLEHDGRWVDHKHEPIGELSYVDYARRCLTEGETHHGKADTAKREGEVPTVDRRPDH